MSINLKKFTHDVVVFIGVGCLAFTATLFVLVGFGVTPDLSALIALGVFFVVTFVVGRWQMR